MERTGQTPRLVTMAATAVVIAALYLAKVVLIPFALAMLVSFLLAPLVMRLQRWRLSRVMAVIASLLLVLVVSTAVSWVVLGQLRDVTTNLAEYKQNIQEKVATLRVAVAKPVESATKIVDALGSDLTSDAAHQAARAPIQTVRIAEPVRNPLVMVSETLGPALDILMTAAMAFLFAFVMLLRRDDLGDRFIHMVGHGQILVTTRALDEAASKVSSYLWRLLLLNGMHGIAVGIGLAFIGVPNALLWGVLAAILRFIPYVGPWIAATFPVLVSLAISPGWSMPIATIGLFALLELISNNLLEPWIYATGTGLSPLAILASGLLWTWLWGPVGLVLSTPLTVCLVVMGKYVPQLQFLNALFGDTPALSPPARLYQRLIAGDQDQVWLVLRDELEKKPLFEVYDGVVLPALSMAEHDRQRGALDEHDEARIEETLKLLLEEAGELRVEAVAEGGATLPSPEAPRVLCLPARGKSDALAATMLGQVLGRMGAHVAVAGVDELSGETLDSIETRRVDIVCISAVPPSRFMHVRYLCKRIAGRYPKLPIVAGMWTLDLTSDELDTRLPPLPGVRVVTSLTEARTQVRELAESVRYQRAATLAANADAPARDAAT